MKQSLKNYIACLFFILTLTTIGEVKWQTNLKKAQDRASKEGKDIFAYFTGSDWCTYCIVLNKKVFTQDGFLEKLENEYVLLKLDFPQTKALPEVESQLNDKHSKDYSIEGFPTVLLLDKDGRAFAKTGFRDEGPLVYVKHLRVLKKNKDLRDAKFAEAKNLKGIEKSKVLVAALSSLGDVPLKQYQEIQNLIVKSDPNDITGYQKNVLIKQALAGLEEKVVSLVENRQAVEAVELIDEFISKKSPQGEVKQKALIIKIYTYDKDTADLDEVGKLMDSIIAIDPKSETAENARSVKSQLKEMKGTKE